MHFERWDGENTFIWTYGPEPLRWDSCWNKHSSLSGLFIRTHWNVVLFGRRWFPFILRLLHFHFSWNSCLHSTLTSDLLLRKSKVCRLHTNVSLDTLRPQTHITVCDLWPFPPVKLPPTPPLRPRTDGIIWGGGAASACVSVNLPSAPSMSSSMVTHCALVVN